MYLNGRAVARDARRGERYLTRACNTDHLPACMRLANAYASDDLLIDVDKAAAYFSRSCELGSTHACEAAAAAMKRLDGQAEEADRSNARGPDATGAVDAERDSEPELQWTGLGTCFAVSGDGLVVTAAHVVSDSDAIGIKFENEDVVPAVVVSVSSAVDLVVLRTERRTKRFLRVMAKPPLELGDSVFTIGFPKPDKFGWEPKFTQGTISSLTSRGQEHLMQLSVPVHTGNSGGAVVTENGTLAGIIVARVDDQKFVADTGDVAGEISFAIKAPFIAAVIEEKYVASKASRLSRREAIKLASEATCMVLKFQKQ